MTWLLSLLLFARPVSPPPDGHWKAVLDLAGGALPFQVRISRQGHDLRGELCNGDVCQPFSAVRLEQDTLVLEIADYAAVLKAKVEKDSLNGFYHNVGSRGPRTIPFRAERGQWPVTPAPAWLLGTWNATYFSELGSSPRVFEFRNGRHGTEAYVMSSSTDYGPFAGTVHGDSFALGLFDGSFVYLVTGRLEGDTLRGLFHAGLKTQTPWIAVRGSATPQPPAPTEVPSADTTAPLRFAFPDLDGHLLRSDDPRFRGKVVLVEILGSWCPTCHQSMPELFRLYRRYHSRGLEVVGLAFESTGDPAIDGPLVRRYRDKFKVPFPLLLAGINDERSIADALPQLRDITAFPTTVFLGRDGRVRRIYAGYHGLASGTRAGRMGGEFEREILRLLREQPGR